MHFNSKGEIKKLKFMGSKNRIKKYILPIIQEYADKSVGYLEPFVGGANVIDGIVCKKRIGADRDKYLIALLRNADKLDELPLELAREEYEKVRDNKESFEDWYVGAVGYLGSYNGRGFPGGFARSSGGRNYWDESVRNLRKQRDKFEGIEFIVRDFKDTPKDLKGWCIYCDPPYKGTQGYGASFDFDAFVEWCKKMSEKNFVLVSEQDFPIGKVLWEKDVVRDVGRNKKDAVEKLFLIE